MNRRTVTGGYLYHECGIEAIDEPENGSGPVELDIAAEWSSETPLRFELSRAMREPSGCAGVR